jgi:hypothetical protein
MPRRIVAILAALTFAPLVAEAQSFRCISKDGKRYYGSTIPAECYGRPVEQLNAQGMVVKRIDPEGGEKERLAKQAADSKKREEDAASREVARRNHALLATYTSEKDIDDARARSLAENTKATGEVESTIQAVRKRHSDYVTELDLHKGKNEPPARLRDDIKNAQDELKAQQNLLEVKKREVEQINARYDDDKKRYVELSGKTAADRGVALGMDKGQTVSGKGGSTLDQRRNQLDAQRQAAKDRAEVERLEREMEAARRRSRIQQQRSSR